MQLPMKLPILLAAKYKKHWLEVLLAHGDQLKNSHKKLAPILNPLQHYIESSRQ